MAKQRLLNDVFIKIMFHLTGWIIKQIPKLVKILISVLKDSADRHLCKI